MLLDIGAVSTSLVVWGNQELYFTRDIPIGAHDFVKELAERKDKSYLDAQDLLIHEGVGASSAKTESDSASMISVADRTVDDSLAEDIRRSLRFYAKTTGQSSFLKIFLSGGGAATPGLDEFINEKLNVPVDIFNPFEALRAQQNNVSVSNRDGGNERFTPRRILPEDVPPGMRVVSTPFGDRLVEQ